ncbi:hypothetical protein [Dapis sp. BLCC M172]
MGKEEGRRKKEGGRRKKEGGRRKKEEGGRFKSLKKLKFPIEALTVSLQR